MHVAYVRGSVLLRHVDDRPHRLSTGRADGSAQRGRSVIYDCLVMHVNRLNFAQLCSNPSTCRCTRRLEVHTNTQSRKLFAVHNLLDRRRFYSSCSLNRSQTLPMGSIYGLLVATSCSYRVTSVRCPLAGRSLRLARWPETCHQTVFVIQYVSLTASGLI